LGWGNTIPFVCVVGLVDGQAQASDPTAITVKMSDSSPILSLSWGSFVDGADYGTSLSPSDFSSGVGGSLYLTVTANAGIYRLSFPIIAAEFTSNVAAVTQITVEDHGDGTTSVNLSGEDPFAGVYQVQTSDLDSGLPVLVRDAEWTPTGGGTQYDLTSPLWLVPNDSPATFNHEIMDFNGNTVLFADPFIPADLSEGYIYCYTAENHAGAVTAPTVFIQRPPQTELGFDDSHFSFIDGSLATRKIAIAFRMQIDLAAANAFGYAILGSAFQASFDGPSFSIGVRNILPGGAQSFSLGESGTVTFSVVMVADLDGSVRLDVHSGTSWTTLLNSSNIDPNRDFIGQAVNLGAQSSGSAGPAFTLYNQFWQHNDVPNDVTVLRDALFEADGSIKDLPPSGRAAGLSPIFHFRGDNFLTAQNSGYGPEGQISRTPITVTEV